MLLLKKATQCLLNIFGYARSHILGPLITMKKATHYVDIFNHMT